MSENNIFTDFMAIFTAWNVGKSDYIIYDLIINWVKTYRSDIPYVDVIDELIDKIDNTENIEEFVEDFIYGDTYMCLRVTYYQPK